jgi:hypothetical protein
MGAGSGHLLILVFKLAVVTLQYEKPNNQKQHNPGQNWKNKVPDIGAIWCCLVKKCGWHAV